MRTCAIVCVCVVHTNAVFVCVSVCVLVGASRHQSRWFRGWLNGDERILFLEKGKNRLLMEMAWKKNHDNEIELDSYFSIFFVLFLKKKKKESGFCGLKRNDMTCTVNRFESSYCRKEPRNQSTKVDWRTKSSCVR